MQTKVKGRTTIRTAAICFLASAVFELLDLASPVPLLGAMRSGLAAMGYHLIFTAVFLGMGIGLWTGKPWGYGMLMAGTAAYSIDKAQIAARAPDLLRIHPAAVLDPEHTADLCAGA